MTSSICCIISRHSSYESCNGSPKTLDPAPLQKWAGEGYVVAQILFLAPAPAAELASQIAQAAEALRQLEGW